MSLETSSVVRETISRKRSSFLGVLGSIVPFFLSLIGEAMAAELRVLDASGLARAAKIVKERGAVVILLGVSPSEASSAVCTLKSVDGLADDLTTRGRESANGGECVFEAVAAGTWETSVQGADRWSVRVVASGE
jgi:hypothetical protein